jgi:hypothetical protein
MGVLAQSGWTLYDSNNTGGIYVAQLASGPHDEPWFVVISGDGSVSGAPVITVQIGSPDVTEK